jgi:hypothetical protein
MQLHSIWQWLLALPLIINAATWFLPWEKLHAKYLGPLWITIGLSLCYFKIGLRLPTLYLMVGSLVTLFAYSLKEAEHKESNNEN